MLWLCNERCPRISHTPTPAPVTFSFSAHTDTKARSVHWSIKTHVNTYIHTCHLRHAHELCLEDVSPQDQDTHTGTQLHRGAWVPNVEMPPRGRADSCAHGPATMGYVCTPCTPAFTHTPFACQTPSKLARDRWGSVQQPLVLGLRPARRAPSALRAPAAVRVHPSGSAAPQAPPAPRTSLRRRASARRGGTAAGAEGWRSPSPQRAAGSGQRAPSCGSSCRLREGPAGAGWWRAVGRRLRPLAGGRACRQHGGAAGRAGLGARAAGAVHAGLLLNAAS